VEPDRGDSSTYELFSGSVLDVVKGEAAAFLKKRDVAVFEDVIEYSVGDYSESRNPNLVTFDCRAARVSRGEDERVRLEKDVTVGSDGTVVLKTWSDGQLAPTRPHQGGFDSSVPYTPERWRKCVAVRDGLRRLKKLLAETFADDSGAAEKLDSLGDVLSLPPAQVTREERDDIIAEKEGGDLDE
jgi:hypothetical protein